MISKLQYYTAGVLIAIIAVLGFMLCKHECPIIVKTKTETRYVSSSPITLPGKPINTPIEKPEPIIKLDTIEISGKTIIKKDTFYKYVITPSQNTFTNLDTAFNDSLGVAINQRGNCLGIQSSEFTFFGKQKVIETTNNIVTPPQVFSLYGGVSNQIKDNTIADITPSALVMYKAKLGFEYGYGVISKSHNVGIKYKLK